MAAYRTHATGGGTTGTGNRTASITTVAGDLLVVFAAVSVNTNDTPTCVDGNTDGRGTYYRVDTATYGTVSNKRLSCWIRDQLVLNAESTVVTAQTGSNESGRVHVIAISGMRRAGRGALRQFAVDEVMSALTTPAPVFAASAYTQNLTLGAVANESNPATLTPPTNWTERGDTGSATPNIGLETVSRDSGFTGTTITWGGTSPTTYADLSVELDTSPIILPQFVQRLVGPTWSQAPAPYIFRAPPPPAPDLPPPSRRLLPAGPVPPQPTPPQPVFAIPQWSIPDCSWAHPIPPPPVGPVGPIVEYPKPPAGVPNWPIPDTSWRLSRPLVLAEPGPTIQLPDVPVGLPAWPIPDLSWRDVGQPLARGPVGPLPIPRGPLFAISEWSVPDCSWAGLPTPAPPIGPVGPITRYPAPPVGVPDWPIPDLAWRLNRPLVLAEPGPTIRFPVVPVGLSDWSVPELAWRGVHAMQLIPPRRMHDHAPPPSPAGVPDWAVPDLAWGRPSTTLSRDLERRAPVAPASPFVEDAAPAFPELAWRSVTTAFAPAPSLRSSGIAPTTFDDAPLGWGARQARAPLASRPALPSGAPLVTIESSTVDLVPALPGYRIPDLARTVPFTRSGAAAIAPTNWIPLDPPIVTLTSIIAGTASISSTVLGAASLSSPVSPAVSTSSAVGSDVALTSTVPGTVSI